MERFDQPSAAAPGIRFSVRDLAIALAIALATLAVYQGTLRSGFLVLDDGVYVTGNPHVRAGLTVDGVRWAFSFATKEGTYWHPLTWLSHMADCELFGLDPGLHHLTNLALHILNAVLLFFGLGRLTGRRGASALVAALFALHPLNVESEAWVAERKNLLSTTFLLLTVGAWARYAVRPGLGRYLLVVLAMTCGLLAKPTLVMVPAALLVLDRWPLGRWPGAPAPPTGPATPRSLAFLVAEKVPLGLLAVASAVVSVGSLGVTSSASLAAPPLGLRIANATVIPLRYLWHALLPHDLAVYYPYPYSVPLWQVGGAVLVLLAITLAASRRPAALTGWLWFLIMLAPTSGLVQAGWWPAWADRWGYVPLIGLFVAVVWSLAAAAERLRVGPPAAALVAGAWLTALALATAAQAATWRDSLTLFEHAARVTPPNVLTLTNLGQLLSERGEPAAALPYLRRALALDPSDATVHNGLGVALARLGRLREATAHFQDALRLRPDLAVARANLERARRLLADGHDGTGTIGSWPPP